MASEQLGGISRRGDDGVPMCIILLLLALYTAGARYASPLDDDSALLLLACRKLRFTSLPDNEPARQSVYETSSAWPRGPVPLLRDYLCQQ